MAGPSSRPARSQPIWSRKKDLFYIAFLSFFVFLAFTIDFIPWYPIRLPTWTRAVYNYYRANYNDPLYAKDPPFFQFYVVLEAVYSVPTCIWAIRGLVKDDKVVPVYLLVLATHLITSTLVCAAEVMGAEGWPRDDINRNLPGYVGFAVIAMVMWADMFSRVKDGLTGKAKVN